MYKWPVKSSLDLFKTVKRCDSLKYSVEREVEPEGRIARRMRLTACTAEKKGLDTS